jgi:hypothetical protein
VEEPLTGGNSTEGIVRVDGSVRRPTGPWTEGVHAVLRHLEQQGFDGAPRGHGIDDRGREILDYIDGDVVHPDHTSLLAEDSALAEVARVIRRFHDAVESFDCPERFAWSDRGADPRGPRELLCHNDLAPWNLVRTPASEWVFIDWDFAAPGRRAWDIAFALLSMVPLMPDGGLDPQRIIERIAVFRDAYGAGAFPDGVLEVAVERCTREADLIEERGAAEEPPYDRLLRDGHAAIWRDAASRVAADMRDWSAALG